MILWNLDLLLDEPAVFFIVVPLSFLLLLMAVLAGSCHQPWARDACPCSRTVKAVVVTGGHGFEREAFLEIFRSFDDVFFTEAPQHDDSEIFEDINSWPYDVIVLYNMTQRISARRRAHLLQLLDRGVGLVVLHHALASFQDWPEYRKIVGGKYFLAETEIDGVKYLRGAYRHDVDIPIEIIDKEHPVTRGMDDFIIHDETYKNYIYEPDNHYLLRTDHPLNNELLGWTRTYRAARICYLQLGHGPSAYRDENYRRLVHQALKWCAGKD